MGWRCRRKDRRILEPQILERALGYQWVNRQARLGFSGTGGGHGPDGTQGNFDLASPKLRDQVSFDYFKASGFDIQPLYAGDAQQMALTTGEEQYMDRWTFDASLQYNPVLVTTIQSANKLAAGLISVGRTYLP